MSIARVISEEIGGSPLARGAQRGEFRDWYRPRPRDAAGWREYALDVARPFQGGEWLAALTPALAPTGVAADRLRGVANGEGVIVSTGQQAALFGGPLYTLLKALSALAVADLLVRETGVPAAPVFWAATDDADFEEASTATVAVAGGARTLRLPTPAHASIPMSRVPLDDSIGALIRELEDACGSAANEAPLAAIRASHRPGTTLGNAYVQLLREVLEPLGIAVLDASHPAVRRAGAAVISHALDRAEAIERALRDRAAALVSAGFTPQVEQVPGLSLVFAEEDAGEKRRLPLREAMQAGQRYAPDLLGPNVLLRPLLERSILPSAAYIAGPAEIAYFAQVSAVSAMLDIPTPLVLPRLSATVVEPRIERLLARLGVAREELADPHVVENRLARAAVPPRIADALMALRRDVDANVAALQSADERGLIPGASVESLRRAIMRRIERAERRYAAAIKRQESELMRDVATARGALYPGGARQERVLSFIPFLARYGAPLLEMLRADALRHATTMLGVEGWRRESSSAGVAERV
jgi:bacillithiol biosynthesis cysteine-adding enzyme BshC